MGIKTFVSQRRWGGGEKQQQMEIICPLKFIHYLQSRIYFRLQDCQHFVQGYFKYSSQKNVAPSCLTELKCFHLLWYTYLALAFTSVILLKSMMSTKPVCEDEIIFPLSNQCMSVAMRSIVFQTQIFILSSTYRNSMRHC